MTSQTAHTIELQQRVIRVFVSSTFKDMKEEREVLVKRTFPQLRKICEERGVTWGEVDLRWGVTEEQKAEGKVLPICLEEIKRCRPYFIGLLGERYGWIPDTIPHDLIDREPWLKEHLSHSVTELEILHGVLNNPEMAEHAFFYFRDPEYIRRLPEGAKRADFLSEDEDAREKLEKLKGRIRKSGFPVHENFPDPKTLGELVLQDLTKFIDVLYPPDQKIDPLDRDALDHEAYAQSRSQVYIGREAYFDRLNKHTQSTDPPLVILGESGSGKSALLANWALKYREEHPHELLVLHFIGASPYSADWAAMLRRIMGELKRHFNIPQEIPDKSDELRSAFANYLHMVSAACLRPSSPLAGEDRGEGVERFSKVILILDALNQLEDHEGALDLVWLPPFIPENIRIFLSTLPGRPLDDLTKRGWPTLTVELLAADERKALIPIYLKQYTKELSAHRIEKIAQAEQTYNPLFLKVLLEELRLFGEHERLDERINHYLEAKDPYELYGKVLARWEEDYGKDLVKDSMPLIWASRRGLTESELLDLLGKDGEPLPRAAWSPLFLAARESLISRSGFLTFAHNFLRDAVRGTYMPIGEDQQSVHLRLADYFEKQELTPRKVDELPWQFRQPNSSRSRQRLYDLLSDLSFFSAAWQKDQFDVKAYWSYLESNSLKMSDAYKPVLTSPENIPDKNHVWQIATLLDDTGNPHEAFSLRTFLVEHYRQNKDIDSLQRSLGNQALILKAWGRLDEAMKLLKEQEWICRELGNIDGIQASLGNQANILYAWGRLDEAMKLHKEEEGICRELGNKDGLSASLCNQGVILQGLGRLEEAMRLHKEEEQICRERGNKDGIQISLGNQATILKAWGRLDEAMKLLKEQERICRELGNKNSIQTSLNNQALILKAWGRLDEAMKLFKEKKRICRELGNKDGLSGSLGNQALILKAWGRLDEAMKLSKEQEQICRELGNKDNLLGSLGNQALILQDWGRLDEAMKLHKEEESICRELGNKDGLSRSLGNQALILKAWSRLEEAMKLHKEEEGICGELGNKDGLSRSLGNQANILYAWGRLEEAMKLHKEEEQICRELGNKNSLSISLGSQAAVLYGWGRLDEAMKLYKEEEQICRELGNPGGLALSLSSQAHLLAFKIGKPKDALPLVEEAYNLTIKYGLSALKQQIKPILDNVINRLPQKGKEQICRELGDKDGIRTSLFTLALIAEGRLDEAMKLLKEQERICRELGNKDGIQDSLGNQAFILRAWGRLEEAMKLLKETEQICRELGNKDGLSGSLGNQALILKAWGRLEEAMKLHKEEEGICRELGNKDGLSASLCNQGVILQGLGRLEEAMRLHKEEEQICRERGNKDGIQISLGNQATILKAWGRLEEAMKLHKETEQICRELGNKNGMHISLGTQAGILYAWGRLEEAMKLLKETEQICRELGNKDGLSGSLGNQALILKAWGRLEEAMKLFKEQERICKELGNKDSIRKSLGNQATILADWGRLEEAMKRLKEEEQICRELGNPQGLAASLAIQAKYLAFKIGKPKDALPLVEEAYNLSIKCGLSALSQGIKPILDGVMTMLKSPKGR